MIFCQPHVAHTLLTTLGGANVWLMWPTLMSWKKWSSVALRVGWRCIRVWFWLPPNTLEWIRRGRAKLHLKYQNLRFVLRVGCNKKFLFTASNEATINEHRLRCAFVGWFVWGKKCSRRSWMNGVSVVVRRRSI